MADVKVLYYLSQPYGNCTLKVMEEGRNNREIRAGLRRKITPCHRRHIRTSRLIQSK